MPHPALRQARALAEAGRTGDALSVLSPLLAPPGTPATPNGTAAAALLAALVAGIRPPAWHPQFARDLLACLAAPIDHQPLARPTAALLAMQPGVPVGDPLWIAFLTRCINVDPAMEARIAALRGTVAGTPPGWRAALAVQAFATGYLLPPADVGSAALDRALDAAPPEADRAALTAIGDPVVDLLVARAIDEPAAERALIRTLPAHGADDAGSASVRAQYEAWPYPRWQAPPVPDPRSLSAALNTPIRRVLVAGCGTGYEPIDLARTDPSVEVTAIDLSAASLAYGMRMAEALRVPVAFARADLLRLAGWDDRFDLVTSTGVLHHLSDPLAGLRALARVVRPGGIVRIALYSRRARAPVAAAHVAIAAHGWSATPADLRAFRAHVLTAPPRDPLAALAGSDDFYTAAGCRDLCFHPREHLYSLPEAGALITAAGLSLVGIDAPPAARRAFGTGDSLDLRRWDAAEARDPALFAGMYHLWCRRP